MIGRAAEGVAFIAATFLCLDRSGASGLAAYLAASALSVLVASRTTARQHVVWLSPAGFSILGVAAAWRDLGGMPFLAAMLVAGMATGIGACAAGRGPAVVGYLKTPLGFVSFASMGAAMVTTLRLGAAPAAFVAATLALVAVVRKESGTQTLVLAPPIGALSAWAMSFVSGLHPVVLELAGDPKGAVVFTLLFSLGVFLASRREDTDVRLRLAAPFGIAAALTIISTTVGPGQALLWFGVGYALRYSAEWRPVYALGVVAGAIAPGFLGAVFLLQSASVLCLVCGAVTLYWVRRKIRLEAQEIQLREPVVVETVNPNTLADAATIILGAIEQAREIRAPALSLVKEVRSQNPVGDAALEYLATMRNLKLRL